jgi:hypothetical protein
MRGSVASDVLVRLTNQTDYRFRKVLTDVPFQVFAVAPPVNIPVRTVGTLTTWHTLPAIRAPAVDPLEHVGAVTSPRRGDELLGISPRSTRDHFLSLMC